MSIYFALLTPQWKQTLRSSSMQIGETWSLIGSIARPDRQNRKFPPILIITEAKNAYFFVCKRTGFAHQKLRDFVKLTLTRVSCYWLWLESSQVILWKTWLDSSRVTIFLNVTRIESESPKIVTRVESLTRVTLSLINTKITEGKLNKIFILEVWIKLVALRINPYTRSSSQFQKGWWPLH